jgi:hypothetical protein
MPTAQSVGAAGVALLLQVNVPCGAVIPARSLAGIGRVAPFVLSVPRLQCLRCVSGGRWSVCDPNQPLRDVGFVAGYLRNPRQSRKTVDSHNAGKNGMALATLIPVVEPLRSE